MRKYFCLQGFSREDLLKGHKPECKSIEKTAVRVEMPEEGKNKLTFQNWHKQLNVPYTIYADFEALTTKVVGVELDPTKGNTQKTQMHEACGNGYIVVRCDGHTMAPVVYRCPAAAERFLEDLQEEEKKIKAVLAKYNAMHMAPEDWQTHHTATHCHVCEKPVDGDSVSDHCHITGKYRGAAHIACNLKLRLNPKTTTIPVVFHNLRGYDGYLIMHVTPTLRAELIASHTTRRRAYPSCSESCTLLTALSSSWPRLKASGRKLARSD